MPHEPAISAEQCYLAMQFNLTLSRTEFVGSFIETILNAPCGTNDPNTAVLGRDAGSWSCTTNVSCARTAPHPAVVVEASSCDGLGTQVTGAGDETTFELTGTTISREHFWGGGCGSLPEFVLAYTPSSPVELRLCHDDMADSCEAVGNPDLSYDLGTAFAAAGTTEFRFVD